MTPEVKEKFADKINKLLRKAESTTPEEAEALVAKAQELMTRYAIDNAMLEANQDKPTEEIVEEAISFTGGYQKALMQIAFSVLKQNDCEGFYRNIDYERPNRHDVVVIGHESDVERVKLLCSSLQLQAISAMQTWWKGYRKSVDWMDKGAQWRERRQFIFGFATGLEEKLAKARKAGMAEAAKDEAKKAGSTEEEASESMALVVRSRKDKVSDWKDEKYGGSLRTVRARYTPGSIGGSAAGVKAGRRANTNTGSGQVGVGGRHALGSGS